MNIVYITYAPNPTYRDPEAWLRRISGALDIMEHMTRYGTVTNIHSIGYRGALRKAGVDYLFFNCTRWELLFPFFLHRQVAKLKPDTVIIRGLIFPLQVILLRLHLGRGVTLVAQHHAERPLRSYKRYFQKMADRFIGAYFFASKEHGRRWVEAGQISDESKVVEAMVVSSTFHPIDLLKAKSVTGVGDGKIYLWVGGLDKNKDPFTLLTAFKSFAEQHPGVRLFLIYRDSEMLDEVLLAAQDCSQVTLLGKVEHDDLLYWYNSADFIVSTSFYEGGGTAVCEGMSCGCVPILSDIPSLRWISNNGNCGFLFHPGNVGELRGALDKSLQLDIVSEREKVLKHHTDLLSAAANAKKIIDVITSLAGDE